MLDHSVEVERRPDRLGDLGFLLRQQDAQLASEHADRDGDDVVAADHAVVFELVGWADRHLGGQATDGAGDGRDGDPAEVRA